MQVAENEYETLMSRLCILVENAKTLEFLKKGSPLRQKEITSNLTIVRKEIAHLCNSLQKIGASYESLSKIIKGHV